MRPMPSISANPRLGIGVRLGQLEEIGRSEGEEIGLRVCSWAHDRRRFPFRTFQGRAFGRAVEPAPCDGGEATEDRFAGLAPEEMLATGPSLSSIFSTPCGCAFARTAEGHGAGRPKMPPARCPASPTARAARQAPGGASRRWPHRTASGVVAGNVGPVSAVVMAGEGGDKQRDYDWHQARHLSDLESPAESAAGPASGRSQRLAPSTGADGQMPVCSTNAFGQPDRHLAGAISGSAIARKTSFVLGHEDKPLFAPGITVRDDPHRRRGLRSRAFDAEGLPTAARAIVDRRPADGLAGGKRSRPAARLAAHRPCGTRAAPDRRAYRHRTCGWSWGGNAARPDFRYQGLAYMSLNLLAWASTH
jgi:PmbA protein